MPGPKILPGILVVLPSTMLVTAQPSFGGSTSVECRAGPGASAPAGLHWYYRVDRANNRHCWYLQTDGLRVHASGDVVSSSAKPRHEDAAKRARETTPTQSSTIQPAPPRPVAAPATGDETPFLAPSLPKNAATDFAARWRDLPQSVDLDARELATNSNRYGAENVVTEVEEQTPSTAYIVPGVDTGVKQNSAGEAGRWSLLLASVLAVALLVLLRKILKLARTVSHEVQNRRRTRAGFETSGSRSASVGRHAAGSPALAPGDPAYSPETARDGLVSILRRVDAALDSSRSFAPPGVQITKSKTDRGISKHFELSNPTAYLVEEKSS